MTMVLKKHRSPEAWGPVSPAPAPRSQSARINATSPEVMYQFSPAPYAVRQEIKKLTRPKSQSTRINATSPQVMHHFSPAPYAVRQEIKKLTRPKSTPAHLIRLEGEKNGWLERPHTVPYGHNTKCARLSQLEHEPTRKQNFEVHLPTRKPRSPPWQRKLDIIPVPIHSSNGFDFSKSKDKILVKLRTEDFFDRPESEPKVVKKPVIDPAIENLILQLQEQINDLTVYLEEERLNHRETIKRADEILRMKMAVILRDHDDEVKQMIEDHATEVQDLNDKYQEEIKILNETRTAETDKLKAEIEFLQSAFESYKTSLHTETADKWRAREEEIQVQHEEEIEKRLLELKQRLLSERNVEKINIQREFKKEVEQLENDHKREIETLKAHFALSAFELSKLQGVQKQYEELRRDHLLMQQSHKEMTNNLSGLVTELSDTKIKLLEYEASFHLRVQQVDDRYKAEVHSLMSENTELRRSYMRKCAELYDAKVKFEKNMQEKDQIMKEALKGIKKPDQPMRAPIAISDVINEHERRCSVPSTDREHKMALMTVNHNPLESFDVDPKFLFLKGDSTELKTDNESETKLGMVSTSGDGQESQLPLKISNNSVSPELINQDDGAILPEVPHIMTSQEDEPQ